MTAAMNGDEVTPTPAPWEDDEQSIRAGLRALATRVLERLGEQDARLNAMTSGLQLELQGIRYALDDLKDRSQDTGRHIIQIAEGVGEAKGMAARRKDSDPIRSLLIVVVESVTKHVAKFWLSHTLTAAIAAGLAWWATHHR